MSEGVTLPLDPLLQSMKKFIVPEKQEGNTLSLSTSIPTDSYEDDLGAVSITVSLSFVLLKCHSHISQTF